MLNLNIEVIELGIASWTTFLVHAQPHYRVIEL